LAEAEAGDGATILDAIRRAGIAFEASCGGAGTCGKCRVRVRALSGGRNAPPPLACVETRDGAVGLPDADAETGRVLACRSVPQQDIEVELPSRSEEGGGIIGLPTGGVNRDIARDLAPFVTKRHYKKEDAAFVYGGAMLLARERGGADGGCCGVALDIGTTTLEASLLDLRSGARLASDAAPNPQSAYANDVLSRVRFASEPSGLAALHAALASAVNGMIGRLTESAGVPRERVYEAVCSGNTAMLHLAAAVNPRSLGLSPYTPRLRGGCSLPARAVGVRIAPCGLVYLPPVISAYVGADITCGLVASRLWRDAAPAVLIDIGTNGEMALECGGALYAASAAAGPAFEGMNISCGMRAGRGAVARFSAGPDGTFAFGVIGADGRCGGREEAVGICGSGLLDICGELARVGIIGESGRFADTRSAEAEAGADGGRGSLRSALREKDGQRAFFLTGCVSLTQRDVRQVQLAKSAVRAGVEALLARAGVSAASVGRADIAGSFGFRTRERSLLGIGILPAGFAGKVRFTGNTSLAGAEALLLNAALRSEADRLARRAVSIDLSTEAGFEELFVKHMGFQ
jgi:uncharacterized 2Fe-2S/4Fe-4S cluster protein (DUF4445 family)